MIPLKSKVTIKVLNYYFLNPNVSHYVNELARILDLDPKNLYRKLSEFEKEGILESKFAGKQRYFSLNKNSKIIKIYKELFAQTVGLEEEFKKAIKKVKGVQEAYIYGSYAKQKLSAGSDIDLLVIGGHSILELQKEINKIQKWIGREVNIINLSKEEFQKKRRQKNPFIKSIFSGKHIKLL